MPAENAGCMRGIMMLETETRLSQRHVAATSLVALQNLPFADRVTPDMGYGNNPARSRVGCHGRFPLSAAQSVDLGSACYLEFHQGRNAYVDPSETVGPSSVAGSFGFRKMWPPVLELW